MLGRNPLWLPNLRQCRICVAHARNGPPSWTVTYGNSTWTNFITVARNGPPSWTVTYGNSTWTNFTTVALSLCPMCVWLPISRMRQYTVHSQAQIAFIEACCDVDKKPILLAAWCHHITFISVLITMYTMCFV